MILLQGRKLQSTSILEKHYFVMARKSQRLSAGKASSPATHKRAASGSSLPGTDTKKSRTQKATPTKSQYFSKAVGKDAEAATGTDDEDELQLDEDEEEEVSSAPDEDLSEFGSAPESDGGEDEDDDEDEYESEIEEPKSRRRSSAKKAASATTKKASGGELWREGTKTGLGPGQQVVIKKPKARPAGKIPYSDDTIHPNTLLFLKDLKGNNNREWLKSELLVPQFLQYLPSAISACRTSWAICSDGTRLHDISRCHTAAFQLQKSLSSTFRAITSLHPVLCTGGLQFSDIRNVASYRMLYNTRAVWRAKN